MWRLYCTRSRWTVGSARLATSGGGYILVHLYRGSRGAGSSPQRAVGARLPRLRGEKGELGRRRLGSQHVGLSMGVPDCPQRRPARPNEAQEPRWGTAKGAVRTACCLALTLAHTLTFTLSLSLSLTLPREAGTVWPCCAAVTEPCCEPRCENLLVRVRARVRSRVRVRARVRI